MHDNQFLVHLKGVAAERRYFYVIENCDSVDYSKRMRSIL